MAVLDKLSKSCQPVAFSLLPLSLLRLFSQLSFLLLSFLCLFPLLLCLEEKCFVVRGAIFAHLYS
jgi:hypothetical protein